MLWAAVERREPVIVGCPMFLDPRQWSETNKPFSLGFRGHTSSSKLLRYTYMVVLRDVFLLVLTIFLKSNSDAT